MKGRFLRGHWSKLAILAIPLIVALTNATWLSNPFGNADTWIYNGYFKTLGAFAADRAAWGPPQYFETRLPIIVPGALVYALFSDGVAKVVLNLCLLHGITALSFWYVVRTHLSRTAATCATVLLVTDVFYLRTAGWDYVDNAVLAYQALTFALLTAPPGQARSRIRVMGAGFAAMSMLTVHLASAVMLPVFASYCLLVARPRQVGRLIVSGTLGAALCLLFWGTISKLVLHGPFAFWLEQLQGGMGHVHAAQYALPLGMVAMRGYWLTVHGAVLVASVLALWIHRLRTDQPLSRFARFCFATSAIFYSLLLVGEGLKVTFYLFYFGLYSSQFLLLSYMTTALLFFGAFGATGARRIVPWVVVAISAVFPILAIARLALGNGLGLTSLYEPPAFSIVLLMAASMTVAFATQRATVTACAVGAFGASTLFVPCRFERDNGTIAARNFILGKTRAPVRLVYAESGPELSEFISIASALTDHVLHDHYGAGPYVGARPIERGDRVVVLESGVPLDQVDGVPCAIEGLAPIAARQFVGRYTTFIVNVFEASQTLHRQDLHCPTPFESDPAFLLVRAYSAAELPAGTGALRGEARVAREGEASAGTLTSGPPRDLAAGVYMVTIHYSSRQHGAANRWDIVAREHPGAILEGELPDTAGQPSTFSANFQLPEPASSVEVRTSFVSGELSVTAIAIGRRP